MNPRPLTDSIATADRPLPAPGNGVTAAVNDVVPSSTDVARERARAVFERLWSGHRDHLPAVRSNDSGTSAGAAERLALDTPDIGLIEVPDVGRTDAVAVEVAAAAAGRGVRVVVAAADEATAARLRAAVTRRTGHSDRVRVEPGDDSRAAVLAEVERLRRQLTVANGTAARLPWWHPAKWFARRDDGGKAEPGEVGRLRDRLQVLERDLDETPAGGGPLVVIHDAHRWTRSAVLDAAAKGGRWVLVGSNAASPNSPFAELWTVLHQERWAPEGERLCCRLLAVSPADRGRLSCEPLADAPEVELRVHVPAGGTPALAEVVFPAGTTLAAAKEFIGRNLEEWPIDVNPAALGWSDADAGPVACLGCHDQHAPVPVEVEPGVRELIAERVEAPGRLRWFTCGFAFDRAAGWDMQRARAWLDGRFTDAGPRRTVVHAS
jgi:hypothetical protein